MENRIKDAFRTNDYIATGERTTVVEPPPANQPAIDVPVRSGPPVEQEPLMESGAAALFGTSEAATLRARWQDIQVAFVDEPRKSVQRADELVETVGKRLTEMFADQRTRLEQEWDRGESSTEELRKAFRRYRTLFDRLLTI